MIFRPLNFASAATLQAGMHYHAFTHSQFSLVNLLTSLPKYHYQWMPFRDQAVILNAKDDRLGVPLMDTLSPADLLEISDLARQEGWRGDFYLVAPEYVQAHPAVLQDFVLLDDRAYADYVYAFEELRTLRGRVFKKKRNKIMQFEKTFPTYTIRPLIAADGDRCQELFQRWMAVKASQQSPWLTAYHGEFEALKLTLAYYDTLQLQGLGVFANHSLISFTLYNSHCAETIISHFLKYDPTIRGSYEIMMWEMANAVEHTYQYLNAQQDMGIPGLRDSKSSYHPISKLASCALVRK